MAENLTKRPIAITEVVNLLTPDLKTLHEKAIVKTSSPETIPDLKNTVRKTQKIIAALMTKVKKEYSISDKDAFELTRKAHIAYMGELFPKKGIIKNFDGYTSTQKPIPDTRGRFRNCYRRGKEGLPAFREHTFKHGEELLIKYYHHSSPVPYEIKDFKVRLEATIANFDQLATKLTHTEQQLNIQIDSAINNLTKLEDKLSDPMPQLEKNLIKIKRYFDSFSSMLQENLSEYTSDLKQDLSKEEQAFSKLIQQPFLNIKEIKNTIKNIQNFQKEAQRRFDKFGLRLQNPFKLLAETTDIIAKKIKKISGTIQCPSKNNENIKTIPDLKTKFDQLRTPLNTSTLEARIENFNNLIIKSKFKKYLPKLIRDVPITEIRLLSPLSKVSSIVNRFMDKNPLDDKTQLLETALAATLSGKNILLFNFGVNFGRKFSDKLQQQLNVKALLGLFSLMTGKDWRPITDKDLTKNWANSNEKQLKKLFQEKLDKEHSDNKLMLQQKISKWKKQHETSTDNNAKEILFTEILTLFEHNKWKKTENNYQIQAKLVKLNYLLGRHVATGCNDAKDRDGRLAITVEANELLGDVEYKMPNDRTYTDLERKQKYLFDKSTATTVAQTVSMLGFDKGLGINPDDNNGHLQPKRPKTAAIFRVIYNYKELLKRTRESQLKIKSPFSKFLDHIRQMFLKCLLIFLPLCVAPFFGLLDTASAAVPNTGTTTVIQLPVNLTPDTISQAINREDDTTPPVQGNNSPTTIGIVEEETDTTDLTSDIIPMSINKEKELVDLLEKNGKTLTPAEYLAKHGMLSSKLPITFRITDDDTRHTHSMKQFYGDS